MRVTILGAGALGSLLGALLSGRHEITLVGRAPHMAAIQKDGLRVEGIRPMHVHPQAKTELDGTEAPELLIFAVKSYDTAKAISDAKVSVMPKTILLSAQNGVGNYEALREAFPNNPVLGASITYGAMLVGPGRILYNGQGEILLGGTVKELDVAGRIGRMFRDASLRALGVPEIRGTLWQKAIVNAAINPITALTGKTNGELLEDPATLDRIKRVVAEAAAVARGLKVQLPERDPLPVVQRVAMATAKNKSSMLQDIEHGRRTEIDAINGAFVEAGRRLGIPTPENEALVRAIHARENRA